MIAAPCGAVLRALPFEASCCQSLWLNIFSWDLKEMALGYGTVGARLPSCTIFKVLDSQI